jgi:DNA-binding transcriptional LysR family regulator
MVYGKRIRSIELRHLRYFIATAEVGSVTKAAGKLGIQQPPLSEQLLALEAAVGTPLLTRSSRGVELTRAGEHLLKCAKKIVRLVEDSTEEARQIGLGHQGSLKVGYTSSAAFHRFVPGALGRFRRTHPDIALNLCECCTSELLEALQAGLVDTAFVRGPIDRARGLVIEPLVTEPMLVAAPLGHRIAKRGDRAPLNLAALAGEALLLYRRKPGPGLYDVILAACHEAGFAPCVAQETPRMIGALNLVASGLGISLVPESMRDINNKAICYVPLAAASRLSAPIQLAYRPGGISPLAQVFIDGVRAHLDETDSVAARTLTRTAAQHPS